MKLHFFLSLNVTNKINDTLINLWKLDSTFVISISKNYDKIKKGQTIKFHY